jgi:hypothetical protein
VVQVEGIEVELLRIVEFARLYLCGQQQHDEQRRQEYFFHLNYPIVNSGRNLELTVHALRVILGHNPGGPLITQERRPDNARNPG